MGRGVLAWIVLAVVVVAVLAVSVASYTLADYSWDRFAGYRSPYVGIGTRETTSSVTGAGQSRRPPAQRLVLVVVEGLREDTSRRMTSLQRLRPFGSALVVTASEPTLAHPNLATLLSGAPPSVNGITTEADGQRIEVETLLDVAVEARRRTVVVGPEYLDELLRAERADATFLYDPAPGEHIGDLLVAQTLDLAERTRAQFVVVYLADLDEAGHESGVDSAEYAEAVKRVDTDLALLVEGLRDPRTTFVITSTHGHLDAGGHGGWERDVVQVPAILAGAGTTLRSGRAPLEDIAPTVAALMGVRAPAHAIGAPVRVVLAERGAPAVESAEAHSEAVAANYAERVLAPTGQAALIRDALASAPTASKVSMAEGLRADWERQERLPQAVILAVAALAVLVTVGLASWRALAAALGGATFYYFVFDGLFFYVHGYRWSLSSVSDPARLEAFLVSRSAEVVLAAVLGALVAGLVYAALRARPMGPREGYGGGWAMLGGVTVLVVQATLALQVAWYLYAHGADVTWTLPDSRWAFKYGLDLTQMTALGVSAFLAPVVTYLVGRYHPRVRRTQGESRAAPKL